MNVLFIGPLPEPMTGQALACRVLFDHLCKANRVDLIDLNKRDFRQGLSSGSRVAEVISILARILAQRGAADVLYLTISESLAGNLKDLLIYSICFRRLRHTVVHLLGGANMRQLMRGDWPVLRRVNSFFLRRIGAVVVEGETQAEIFREAVPRDRIHVVPNFAEDALFSTREQVDAKFECTNPLRVLFLSNLLPGKGHEELVEAFLSLDAAAQSAIELDLAGGFETADQETTFLARLAGIQRIRYHGTVAGERKRELFERAHVFCLPTYYSYEGQPLSILEAYASGCAVITTDHSGIRDVFRDDVNGFQVAKRSVADLRRLLQKAVAQPQSLRRMARDNLQTALEKHRASDYQEALSQVIKGVAAAGVNHEYRGQDSRR
jgi:glycosyltransferase involved in cell wall biosynthesis